MFVFTKCYQIHKNDLVVLTKKLVGENIRKGDKKCSYETLTNTQEPEKKALNWYVVYYIITTEVLFRLRINRTILLISV